MSEVLPTNPVDINNEVKLLDYLIHTFYLRVKQQHQATTSCQDYTLLQNIEVDETHLIPQVNSSLNNGEACVGTKTDEREKGKQESEKQIGKDGIIR